MNPIGVPVESCQTTASEIDALPLLEPLEAPAPLDVLAPLDAAVPLDEPLVPLDPLLAPDPLPLAFDPLDPALEPIAPLLEAVASRTEIAASPHSQTSYPVPCALQAWNPAQPEGPAQAMDAPGTHACPTVEGDEPQRAVTDTTAPSSATVAIALGRTR
jgi:hypothetical protein